MRYRICAALILVPAMVVAGEPESKDRVARVLGHLRKIANADTKTGDALGDHYVRETAGYCAREKIPVKDFLIALGIGLDPSDTLRKHPLTRGTFKTYAATDPIKVGDPTMRKRADWLLHFALSASLTAATNPETAELIGLGKELQDALGPSGFSFTDLAADEAGIAFARQLLARPDRLEDVASSFTGEAFLPPIADLDEGLSLNALTAKYGDPAGDTFRATCQAIRKRINDQAIYKTWTAARGR